MTFAIDYTPTSAVGQLMIDSMVPWMKQWPGRSQTQFAWWLDAWGSMFNESYLLTLTVGTDGKPDFVPGYGALFDPLTCPAKYLPWLGQFVGVTIPAGTDDATARQLVLAEAGFYRGTPKAIRSAIERSISNPWQPNTAYVTGGPLVSFTPPGGMPDYYMVASDFTSGSAFDATDLTLVDVATQYNLLERTNGVTGATNQPDDMTIQVNGAQLTPANDTTALEANVATVRPVGIVTTYILSSGVLWDDATLEWSAVAGSVEWGTVVSGDV